MLTNGWEHRQGGSLSSGGVQGLHRTPALIVCLCGSGRLRQDCSHEMWSDVAGLCSQQINLSPVAVTHRVKAPVPADLQDARGGRREPTLSSCPLTSARVPQHVHQCVHKHINKMIKK